MTPTRVGWVVDAQVDFMDPAGRLYVKDLQDDTDPGAILIAPRLEAAVGWMRRNCAVVVYTGDWHGHEDDEIDVEAPDPLKGTYPPHCMGRSADPEERAGAAVIASIAPRDPLVLGLETSNEEAQRLAREAVRDRRDVFIHKTRFDVFAGNAATEAFVEGLVQVLGSQPEFVVAGVARDVCVTQAVDGLQARRHRVTALRDATWGLGLEAEADTLARWSRTGRVVTLDDLASGG